MPKEYIHSMDHGRSVPVLIDGSEVEDGKPLPVTMHKMDDDAIKLAWDKTYGGVSLTIVDTEKDPDGLGSIIDEPDVRTINLDRTGVNRLIRFLRRARDDAFGRDE